MALRAGDILQWPSTEVVTTTTSDDSFRLDFVEGKTMAYASESVLSGPAVRSRLRSIGAFAGAGILALSVVAAPPDFDTVRSEVRAVRLTASALPGAAYLQALENIVSQGAQAVLPAAKQLAGGSTTTSGATVTKTTADVTPVSLDSTTAPPTATAATLAAPTALAAPAIPFPINALLGFAAVLLLFAPLIVGVILLCPLCAVINELSYILPGIVRPVGALAAASPVSAPAVAASAPAAGTTTGEPADATPPAGPAKADDSPPVTSTDKRTGTELFTPKKPATEKEPVPSGAATVEKDVTETADAKEVTTDPTSSDTKTSPAATKPDKRSVRGSHRDESIHPTTGTADVAEGTGATAGSSSETSPAPSKAKGSRSAGHDSSGGGS